jgi:hypothetical protein
MKLYAIFSKKIPTKSGSIVTHVRCLVFILKQAVLILFLSKELVIEQVSSSTVEKRAEGGPTRECSKEGGSKRGGYTVC